jgi:hypothetical protein
MRFLTTSIFSTLIMAATLAYPDSYGELVSKSYTSVRSALISHGFQPIRLKHDESVELFCYNDFCKRYPEALNCAGTGLNPCTFVYFLKTKRKYLIVNTHGEVALTVTGLHWAKWYELQEIKK